MSAKRFWIWMPALVLTGAALMLFLWLKQRDSRERMTPSPEAADGGKRLNATIAKVTFALWSTPSIVGENAELTLNVETAGTVVFRFDRYNVAGEGESLAVGDPCVVEMDKDGNVVAVNIPSREMRITPVQFQDPNEVPAGPVDDPFAVPPEE